MSQEPTTPDLVALVREQVEALDRGDVDGVLDSVAEEAVLDGRADLVEGRVIQDGRLVGGDGHLRQREGWVHVWAEDSIARLATSEVDQARAAAERLAEERG